MSAPSAPAGCFCWKTLTFVAVFVAGGLTGWMARSPKPAPEPETIEVWVAALDLPVGTVLDQEYLPQVAAKKRITTEEELRSKTLKRGVRQDEPFNSRDLTDGVRVPPGMELISVQFGESEASAAIGYYVDIIATIRRGKEPESFPLVRGVLGIGIDFEPPTSKSEHAYPTRASFAMSKEQMRLVELAKARGYGFELFIPKPRGRFTEAEEKNHTERARQFLANEPK
jgi:Flp pilus assembly protein CpaB